MTNYVELKSESTFFHLYFAMTFLLGAYTNFLMDCLGDCINNYPIELMAKIPGSDRTQQAYYNVTGLPSHILLENTCTPDFSCWSVDLSFCIHAHKGMKTWETGNSKK